MLKFAIKFFVNFLLVCLPLMSSADQDKIAVIVNDDIITERDIFDRKEMFVHMNGISKLSAEESAFLRNASIDSLIEDLLLDQDSKQYNFKISEKDIDSFIVEFEKMRQIPAGELKKKFSSSGKNIYDSFRKKMKSELIKARINNEVISRGVSVSETEIDRMAVRFPGKDPKFILREITSSSNNDKMYDELLSIRQKNMDCNKKIKTRNISETTIEKKLSELPKDVIELTIGLNVSDYSAITDKNDKLVMYQVCEIKLDGFSEEEKLNLSNFIGYNKLTRKMIRYIEGLRNQAYIKIM